MSPEYDTQTAPLTPAERRFRLWMFISAWMYGISGTFFFVAGFRIAPFVNTISEKFLPLPLYPLPAEGPEGSFWLVLSLSMMAMITYICRAAYLDVRRNGRLVPILLLSKFCSTAFYFYYLITQGQIVHLVGVLTDGPLFLATLILWLPAAPGDKYIDGAEEDILAALGDALMPRGGAFEVGYLDFREECIADARRIFARHSLFTLTVCRLMLRVLDLSPIFISLRPITLRRLPNDQRIALLKRIETGRRPMLRGILMGCKIFVLTPFFNREEAARAVGYVYPEAEE